MSSRIAGSGGNGFPHGHDFFHIAAFVISGFPGPVPDEDPQINGRKEPDRIQPRFGLKPTAIARAFPHREEAHPQPGQTSLTTRFLFRHMQGVKCFIASKKTLLLLIFGSHIEIGEIEIRREPGPGLLTPSVIEGAQVAQAIRPRNPQGTEACRGGPVRGMSNGMTGIFQIWQGVNGNAVFVLLRPDPPADGIGTVVGTAK